VQQHLANSRERWLPPADVMHPVDLYGFAIVFLKAVVEKGGAQQR
jgi:hypothetical protein